MITEDLIRELTERQLQFELIAHNPAVTAGQEAAAVGVAPAQVAKTLVLSSEGGFVRAVLQASERLDLHKVRELVGDGKHTRLATEAELAGAYPMFELGAVPPFGGPRGERTIVDRRLAALELLVVDAGSHRESLRMRTEDLLSLAQAEIADICAD